MERKTADYLKGLKCGHPFEITLYNGVGTNTETLPYDIWPFCPVLLGGKCLQENSIYKPCSTNPNIQTT